jgi:hypothetical protein
MVRKKPLTSGNEVPTTREPYYRQFAQRFVDLMLHPDHPWLLHYFLVGGFSYPLESSKDLALDIIDSTKRDFLAPKEKADAVLDRDREKMISLVNRDMEESKPDKKMLEKTFEALRPSALRRSIREAESIFKLHRGPNPKIPIHKYPELALWSARLTPVLEKLLRELESGSGRPISDYLEFWRKEHSEACDFLLRYLARLQQALGDAGLAKRGTKIKSRARVLADALAGSEYELTFRTSLERVRSARKLSNGTS